MKYFSLLVHFTVLSFYSGQYILQGQDNKYSKQLLILFSMFKSPLKGTITTKKPPINFIKTVVSPRYGPKPTQIQTTKNINSTDSDFIHDHYPKNQIILEITLDKPVRVLKFSFPYSQETTIEELIEFLRRELREGSVYFRAKNLNIEYLMTLPHRKVRELESKKIDLVASKIKIDKKGNFLASFQIIKCVGTGGFSKVYLARGFGKLVAMKVISKGFILENEKQNIVQSQRQILERCSGHPFVTQLHMSFETKNNLIFVMEYCNGGQLFNLLRKVRRMTQNQAKFYFLQTLSAINHLHSQKILYRDLKPENIIIDSQGHIRLADYGLSKLMKDDMTYSFCGSAQYMAPQMLLKKGHSFEIDYYCLGALLYELLCGLPPYYSRNQNELFNNILNKQLQFPPNIQLSKDLKKMLQRLLQKDTDLRFKKIEDIFAHPWIRDCSMQEVLAKKYDPPFKTDMFENNFDNSDFVNEEQAQILKLQRERDRGKLNQEDVCFHDFFYISDELTKIQAEIEKNQENRLDFSKKPPQTPLEQHYKDTIWRNGSMKSIDNSQLYLQNQAQHSPRVPQSSINRSNDKFKMFVSQNYDFSSHPSQITNPKGSQIINISRSSELSNTSGSKLIGVRSVPQMQKNPIMSRSNDRVSSPININNYINIYTHKSPPSTQPLTFNNHHYISPQPKKTMSYGNASFEKSIANSSYKTVNNHSSTNGSLQRVKFCSLEKPVVGTAQTSTSYLKNNVYFQQSSTPVNNRGYLSNFKERFNPNQKIKKSYKTNERFNFNFFNATPYKHP